MRLLNTRTLELEEFLGKDVPRYAILSHMWGKYEVTFQDLRTGYYDKTKTGYAKLRRFCALAKEHRFAYAWMDTCCIDKTSSAELSEAINSMYRWYEMSDVCYAYLEDVHDHDNPTEEESSFRKSRWFTRGWTLQELIAPSRIYFYSANWKIIGSKLGRCQSQKLGRKVLQLPGAPDLCELLSTITGIWPGVLTTSLKLQKCSVAQRMSWAASRQTTRPEDIAYCLMGLFDVNMPLLYGEGEGKAFTRLQEEILKVTEDDTLLMHICPKTRCKHFSHPILAQSPKGFRGLGEIEKGEKGRLFKGRSIVSRMTPNGLQVELPICPCKHMISPRTGVSIDAYIAILDCRILGSHLNRGVLVLGKLSNGTFARYANSLVAQLEFEKQEVVLKTEDLITTTKATSIQLHNVRLETICISSSSEVDLKILGSFFGFDSTNIMFQGIEQPSWCSIALREDTATEFENQGVLAKKFKQCLFVDETNDDTFIIVLGAHMKILRGHGVGQSVPYCKILVQEPDHTLEDVHIREFDEQMYPDEDLERLREQDGLEKLTEGLQSATLELTGGRTAVVTVKRKELLDREEYCFKLTIKEKT